MKAQQGKGNDTTRDFVALERSYWQAIRDKDIDAAMRLTHDPCVVAGAQGVASVDRQAFSKMMREAPWTLDDFTLDDVQVSMLRDDVALVAYTVHEELTVDGKPVALDAADTSVWVHQDGRWLCASHTEALSGDPYGRDRQRTTRAPAEKRARAH